MRVLLQIVVLALLSGAPSWSPDGFHLQGVPTLFYELPASAHLKIRPSQFAQEQSAIIEWFDRYRSTAAH